MANRATLAHMTRERTLQPPDPGEDRAIARRDFLHPARDIEAITVNRWPHGYAPEYNPLFDPDVYEERRVNVIGRAKLRWGARLLRG